jgi:hypothetical protein
VIVNVELAADVSVSVDGDTLKGLSATGEDAGPGDGDAGVVPAEAGGGASVLPARVASRPAAPGPLLPGEA